jgi:hypothetical protein
VPALVAILDDAETIPESWNPQQLRAKERFTATVVSRALAGTEEGREALARRLGVRDPWSFAEVGLVSDGFDAIPALLSVYTGTMLDPQTNAAIVNILGALPNQLETTGRLSIARGAASLLRSDDSKVRAIALTILEQKPSIMDDSAVVQTQIRRMADGLEEVTGAEKTSASTLLEKRQAQRMKVAKELSRRQRYGPLDPLDSLKTSDAELRWLNKYLHGQTQHYLQPPSIPDPWGLSYQHYLNGL